ncbi:MAG TPA: pentapeptide repeat-containing protein [Acidimicrobiales bacterium]|nr:pentapeptide repeat-containing protein [Acidimicrobiales bacterium]
MSFTVAVLGLAGLAWLAWALVGLAGFRRHGALSLHDTVSVLQLVFASVAGAGALVALVVAYRRQKVAEATAALDKERWEVTAAHDLTRLLNERFTAIAAQLGDDQPAVRLAGVHAMAGLADDWEESRQTCIDVLCAYLRMPYEPEPDEDALATGRLAFRAEREVRHTVIRVITAHLKASAAVSWQGLNFDFTGVVFDGGSFEEAWFSGGFVDFTGAEFSSGTVNFSEAKFSGSVVSFDYAKFSGSTVHFQGTEFSGGGVLFQRAAFSGGTVIFGGAEFSGGEVSFGRAEFSGGEVSFDALNPDMEVPFGRVKFSGGEVYFGRAEFCGSMVGFDYAQFCGGTVGFDWAQFCGGTVSFGRAEFSGGMVDFSRAEFSGGTVNFSDATDWSSPPTFSPDSPLPSTVVKLPVAERGKPR